MTFTEDRLLFVYGTLKRGQCRSHHLQGMAFVGIAQTVAAYRLFNCGTYPGMVEDPTGNAIEGELWKVTGVCLTKLDEVEGVDIGLYRQAEVRLQPPFEDEDVWTYLYVPGTAGLVDLGSRW